jgi:hypothetical protein
MKTVPFLFSLLFTMAIGCDDAEMEESGPAIDERIEGMEPGDCSDRADNDADGLFDCDDDSCSGAPDCEEADADDDDSCSGAPDCEEADADDTGSSVDEPCEWPDAPFGVDVGSTLPSTLSWEGVGPGDTELRVISVAEFFDCDGRLGDVDAILFATGAGWCPPCREEGAAMMSDMDGWAEEGLNIMVLSLIFEDDYASAASGETAMNWRDEYGLFSSFVAADPAFSLFSPSAGGGIPQNTLVNPRTMQVIGAYSGYDSSYEELLDLARESAGGK